MTTEQPATVAELYSSARRVTTIGLAANLALGITKLVAGFLGHSFALLSDGVHSIGDSFSSVIVLASLYIAQRPADRQHPYGHTRAESVGSLSLAWIIAFTAVLVGWEALFRLREPTNTPEAWTLWVAVANTVLKELLYRVNRHVGQRVGSQAVVTSAWDHRIDAFCSLAVVAGVGAVTWGGQRFAWADGAAALVVIAIILWSAFNLLRTSASQLLDQQADEDVVSEIRAAARNVPGVRGIEKLRVRRSGMELFADMHVEVDPHLSVERGHDIGHEVKARLLDDFTALRDVLVHLEPETHRPESPPQDQ
ncbi:MAG TPA: cation diffusion facilitator family transporter [Lacipirellulaceae bacterium]|jgi:cation diffusion facilitator family transporter